MNDSVAERKATVRNAVLRYLRSHPHASDTTTGIRSWWLPAEGVTEGGPCVEEALEELVRERRLRCFELADGTLIYAGLPAAEDGNRAP